MRVKSTVLSSVALMAACVAVPALAQEVPAASEGGRDQDREDRGDVIVTGQRFEEQQRYVPDRVVTATKSDTPSQETPFSVTAVTRAVLDDQFAVTLADALRNVAGSSPQPGFGQLNALPRIRGFQVNSNLREGFRQASFYSQLDLATVAQIEVLKGPASALYGRFEAGGAVNIVSKKPLEDFYYAFTASGGSDDFYRGTYDIGGPIVPGKLLYRLNAAVQHSDSYRDFVRARKFVVAPSLEWRPGSDTSLLLEAEYLFNNGGFDRGYIVPGNFPTRAQNAAAGQLLLTLPVSRNLGEPTDFTRDRQLRLDAILSQGLGGGWKLRAGIFYSRVRLTEGFFTSGAPLYPSPTVYNRRFLSAYDNPDDVNGAVEVAGRVVTGALTQKLLFGVDASDEDYNYNAVRTPVSSPINPFAPVYGRAVYSPTVLAFGGKNRYRAIGFYGQDEVAVGDFRLLLGGRYDRTEGEIVSAPATTGKKRTTDAFSPRVGATYLVTPAVSLYASWSRSFLTEIGGVLLGGQLPDPSRGRNLEGGLKAGLFGNRLTATAAYYDLTKTNVLVADPANPGFSILTGKQRSRGFELEATANLAGGFNLIGSYAHAISRIVSDTNAAIVGNRIYNTPRDTASLWVTETLQAGSLRGLQLGGGAFYTSSRPVNNANLFYLPAYTRFDALVGYDFGPVRASLNINNITDRRIFDSGANVIVPGAPRQFFVTLGYRGGGRTR